MASTFPIVVIAVVIVATVVAVAVSLASGGLYERIGRGAFSLDQPDGREPSPAVAKAQADEEIRQLVQAKSDRRVARGEAPLDVEAEIAALKTVAPSGVDDELAAEIRQLVVARNSRRAARGQPPLDVEAEVARELRRLAT